MNELLVVMLSITILFFVFLAAKALLKRDEPFCSICLAVSGTWLILLLLSWLGSWENKILLALLIGQSITGIFYLVEKKVPKEWTFFRLPFILTLLVAGYLLLEGLTGYASLLFLAILWLLFMLIFIYRNNAKLRSYVNKVIECCKRW